LRTHHIANSIKLNAMGIVSNLLTAFFILITIITVWQFYRASNNSKKVVVFISILIILQSVLGLSGFYQEIGVIPPRFVLLLGPGILFVLLLFISKKRQSIYRFIGYRKINNITYSSYSCRNRAVLCLFEQPNSRLYDFRRV